MHFKRILLKLSGEVFADFSQEQCLSGDIIDRIAEEITQCKTADPELEIAIVIGGGNFFRGGSAKAFTRVRADHIGMLGTVMNSIALSDILEKKGVETKVFSAIPMYPAAHTYDPVEAARSLEAGKVIICSAGLGSPYFTTDTAASLRAIEINADAVLKASKVDGIYDKDPEKHADAKRYVELTYTEVLEKKLKVMDLSAFALCAENNMKIIVFDLEKKGNIAQVLKDPHIGTIVK